MSVHVSTPEYVRRGLARTVAVVEGSATVLASVWEGMFATAAARRKQRTERSMPRSYPRRYGYLEDAAMCREMRRL
jgi:hypothetical protein